MWEPAVSGMEKAHNCADLSYRRIRRYSVWRLKRLEARDFSHERFTDFDNVISIYIEAPRKNCVESIMKKLQVSEPEAHELISKTDKYRADYYEYYTRGGYWTNPVNYDLTLNSARVGREKCVDVIEDYLKIRFDL